MLYCSNPSCSNPFNRDGNKFCLSCGSQTLSPLFRNRYRVIQLLGEGGFGRTYEAIDTDRMDDSCVIKQFFPQVQGTAALEKATELFKQEAKRLYELGEHPQIPRLIAYFEQDKRLYLVQELIEGQTLLAELNQQGAFSEEKIWQLLADLLPVLKVVHERGQLFERVRKVFSEQLEVAPKEITPTSCLGDLEADELDVLELIMALEDEFDIEISDGDSYEIFKLSQTSGSGAWSWLSSSLSGSSLSYHWDGQLVTVQKVTDYIVQKI